MKPLSALLALSALTTTALAEDWHRWRGPRLDGISQDEIGAKGWPSGDLKQVWKTNVGTGFSSAVVLGGWLIISGNSANKDSVFCLDPKTGKVLWQHTYDAPVWPYLYEGGPNATATFDEGKVYFLGRHGHVFCLHAEDGKIAWSKDLFKDLKLKKPSWGFTSAPLVEGNRLYLNAGTHGLALNKTDGQVIWQSGTEDAAYATPEAFKVGEQAALAVFGTKSLFGVAAADGKMLWEIPWKTDYKVNAAQPIIRGDKIFLSSAYGFGCALFQLGAGEPKELWRNKEMQNHFNSCVLLGEHLYGVSGTDGSHGELRCMEFATGKVTWSEKGLGLGSLIAAQGKLIVLSEKGELVVAPASPQSFKPEYRAQVLSGKCWTPPAFAQGHLFCRNAAGDLVCLQAP